MNALVTPASLGPYGILSLIGAGGGGEVYRAWDPRLERHVALKVLHRRAETDPFRVQRFIGEARAASAEIAEHLGVREGAPVLAFSGVTYIEDGRAIEYFVGVHRGDRSRFETELFRPSAQAEGAGPRSEHVAT